MNGLFLYAHRGASATAPENTLAAFREALAAGADGIELDVHLSADGVPVVIHDDTLERTTDGAGPVSAQSAALLQSLDAGSWFSPEFSGEPLPTLAETLQLLAGHLRVNLEVKDHRAGLAILNLLRDFPATEVVVSSFDHALLTALRNHAPALSLAVLQAGGDWRQALSRAQAINACAFHAHANLVSRPLLAACRRVALPVFAWTVDEPRQARALARIGVAGVFTNDPAGLRWHFPGDNLDVAGA